jgi:hypothetical protein
LIMPDQHNKQNKRDLGPVIFTVLDNIIFQSIYLLKV